MILDRYLLCFVIAPLVVELLETVKLHMGLVTRAFEVPLKNVDVPVV